MNNSGFLGIVKAGKFEPLAAENPNVSRSLRLTAHPLQTAQSPESGEISLLPYEGSAIMVRGVDSGDWIYAAVVVDQAGQILTAVVRQVFDLSERAELNRLPPLLA